MVLFRAIISTILPMLTNGHDHTKNHVVLHVEALPILTKTYAQRACRIGVFGLVQGYPCTVEQTKHTKVAAYMRQSHSHTVRPSYVAYTAYWFTHERLATR